MVTVESGSGQSGSGQRGPGGSDPFAGFGPNEWLVYEMYQQYLKDPESVDKAWGDFFADYQPSETGATNGASRTPTAEKPAKPAAEKPAATEKPAPAPEPQPAPAKPASPEPRSERDASAQTPAPATSPLRGAAARVVSNMEASLT